MSKPLTADPAFWAFSGKATTTFDPDISAVTMPYSAHTVFRHEIDTKGPDIADEGDVFLLPNGDCIEVGTMENPKSGQQEMYKEYWTSPPPDLDVGLLRRSPCLVAKTIASSPNLDTTGVIIRIGDHCQGIFRTASPDTYNEVLVERWIKLSAERNPALSKSHDATEASWLKDGHSNTSQEEAALPCMWLCADERSIHDEVVAKGVTWKVVEVA